MSATAQHAYEVFESLGPGRTLPLLVEQLKRESPERYKGSGTALLRRVKQWSADYQWQTLARRADFAREQARGLEADLARREMNEGQAKLASQLAGHVARRLVDLLLIDQSNITAVRQAQDLLARGLPLPANLKALISLRPALSVGDRVLAQLFHDVVEIERLARGAATEIAQGAGEQDQSAATESATSAATGAPIFYFPTPEAEPPDLDLEEQVRAELDAHAVEASS